LQARRIKPRRCLVQQSLGQRPVPGGEMRPRGSKEPHSSRLHVRSQFGGPGQERGLFAVAASLFGAAGRAFQIVEWDRSHQFCGRCGTRTREKTNERAKECPACGYVVYPRMSPAMMVLVTRGRDVLLARANRFPTAMYSALAGFVEAGESIEDCVHREVLEEVGVQVNNLRYFASQSWPFPHSLMIAYTAEYAGGDMRPCDDEIADAQWFPHDALPQMPPSISISRRLIEATVARLAAASVDS